jgi:hypothetical protein
MGSLLEKLAVGADETYEYNKEDGKRYLTKQGRGFA